MFLCVCTHCLIEGGKNRDELWCFMSVILEMLTDGSVYPFEIFLRCCVSPETVIFEKRGFGLMICKRKSWLVGLFASWKLVGLGCRFNHETVTFGKHGLRLTICKKKKSKREMTANARKQTNHNTQEDTVIYERFFLVWTRQKSVQIVNDNNICKHFAHCFVLSKIESFHMLTYEVLDRAGPRGGRRVGVVRGIGWRQAVCEASPPHHYPRRKGPGRLGRGPFCLWYTQEKERR